MMRPWRAAVARLNSNLEVQWYEAKSITEAAPRELAVSRLGTLGAAEVLDPVTGEKLVLISMYSCWERPHNSTGSEWIYADASAHRLISDLSVFIGQQRGHRIIAAGDLNILYGYGEYGSPYWAQRYRSVFDRMAALGWSLLALKHPMAIRPIHGQKSCRETARTYPHSIQTGRHQLQQHGSSTLCLHRRMLLGAWWFGHSMTQVSGDPAITVASLSKCLIQAQPVRKGDDPATMFSASC